MKEFLIAFLGKTLNLSPDEVASLLFANDDGTELKPGAVDAILLKDTARVQKFKDEQKTFFDNGYKKAQKEALGGLEKTLKEQFQIDSDKQGIELVQAIIDQRLGQGVQLDEDKIKVHPLFTKTVNELNKKIKDTETTWETKYNTRDKEISREKAFASVRSKAKAIIEGMKPILPKDQAKAERQLEWFFKELGQLEFENQDDTIIIMKDGKLLEDSHGNRRNFDALVKDMAGSYWEFEQGQQRQGAGNGNQGQGAGQGQGSGQKKDVKAPKDKAEYVKMIASAKDAEERIAIDDAWQTAQAATT